MTFQAAIKFQCGKKFRRLWEGNFLVDEAMEKRDGNLSDKNDCIQISMKIPSSGPRCEISGGR